MEARELRIGNLVYMPSYKESPLANDFKHIKDGLMEVIPKSFPILDMFPNQFEPIQITEEWLVKLGFEKSGDEFSISSPTKDIFGPFAQVAYYYFVLDIDRADDGSCPDLFSYRLGESDLPAYIDYVHALQNLIFALTGEELTIK